MRRNLGDPRKGKNERRLTDNQQEPGEYTKICPFGEVPN